MQIGERVREIRRKRNMTLADVAETSQLTKGFISQVESGRSNPSLASLSRISQALDVPLAVLIAPQDDAIAWDAAEATQAPMVIPTRNLYHEFDGLTALTGLQAGTHFLATIPAYSALTGGENSSI